ncbi:MAG TPA: hypothetical protein PLC79_04585 [Phycisphaerae bacterium]|nr:hypothetical protein [Phycisphaerae bacterium]
METVLRTRRPKWLQRLEAHHPTDPAEPYPGPGEPKTAAIRRMIADNTYETPDRIALTIERLLDDLRKAP